MGQVGDGSVARAYSTDARAELDHLVKAEICRGTLVMVLRGGS